MRRISLLLVFVPLACATASEPAAPTAPVQSEAVASPSAEPGAHAVGGMAPQLAADALAANAVEKIKLRFDADGAAVKQAVYHDNAAAVPQAVVDRALAVYPGGKPVRYESEMYADAGLVYEVEVETAEGTRCEVSATSDGELRYQECRVDPAALPGPVRAVLDADYADGKVLEAERKTGPGIDLFSVEVEVGGKEFYLQVTPAGDVQSVHQRFRAVVELPVTQD